MMTFDEVWKTLPIPANYFAMDDAYKLRWQGVVEAAFRTGLFEGTYKSGSAKAADSKRISDLEAAVAEIREAMSMPNRFGAPAIDNRAKDMESALKVIHTWASFPESFDMEQTKKLCMSALGREQ